VNPGKDPKLARMGDVFPPIEGTDDQARKRRRRKRRNHNRKKRGLRVWFRPATRKRIIARDGGQCLKCTTTEQLTIDHINPHAEGDKNRDDNLQTLCVKCNCQKGQRAIDYRPKII
jgi:5-methylcytosine-specific restriction endonuclease McrA